MDSGPSYSTEHFDEKESVCTHRASNVTSDRPHLIDTYFSGLELNGSPAESLEIPSDFDLKAPSRADQGVHLEAIVVDPPKAMDSEALRLHGKRMIEYCAHYWESLRERKPLSDVKPGYMWQLMPHQAPEKPESWDDIFKDLEKLVVSGNSNWAHPHFFAYYPTGNSYPALLGDILSGALGCLGFTWNSSPSCTELEMVVMDWMAKALNLPQHFHNSHPGTGAGMIQCSASDSTLVALLSARTRACKEAMPLSSEEHIGSSSVFPNLIAYSSDQAHSSVQRAALFGAVRHRALETFRKDSYGMTGETLERKIKEDTQKGLVPFFVCATIGTTSICAFDKLEEIGAVCKKYGIWLHVDAAYAGSACVCPEFRHILNGVENVDSLMVGFHKWLLINFDCAGFWLKNVTEVEKAFLVDPIYLKHDHLGMAPDLRNLQIPLSRRFRSLKLWFVVRSWGLEGLRNHIRKSCRLAKEMEALLLSDKRIHLFMPATMGLITFRIKTGNNLNEDLLSRINRDRRIHLLPSSIHGTFILRLCIGSTLTNSEDIKFAWSVILEFVNQLNSYDNRG